MKEKRLLQLARHLETGKLGHKEFDFSQFNGIKYHHGERFSTDNCGIVGCALGECPIIFEEWKFSPYSKDPIFKEYGGPISSAMEFFDISSSDASGLFLPEEPCPWNTTNKLSDSATKEEVAQNIRDFIKWKEEGGEE